MITLTGPAAANAMGLKVGRVLQTFPPQVEIDEKSDDYTLVKMRLSELAKRGAASKRKKRLEAAEKKYMEERKTSMAVAPSNGVHPIENRLASLERSWKNLEALLQRTSPMPPEPTPVRLRDIRYQDWFPADKEIEAALPPVRMEEPENRQEAPHHLDKYIGSLILCRDRHRTGKGTRRDRIAWVDRRDGDYLYGGQTGGKSTTFKVAGRTILNNTNYFVLMWAWQNQIRWPEE